MDCFVASLLAMTASSVEEARKKGLHDHFAQPFVVKP
jgi:hypothetical protein